MRVYTGCGLADSVVVRDDNEVIRKYRARRTTVAIYLEVYRATLSVYVPKPDCLVCCWYLTQINACLVCRRYLTEINANYRAALFPSLYVS